jgi:SAM-dependent methyltransferase
MSRIKSRISNFDYFYLTDEEKKLIAKVCSNPFKIKIAPLDKGLSGAKTVLGQIHDLIYYGVGKNRTFSTQISKLYVFKIGKKDKIVYEYNQIKTIAERIIQGFPPTEIAYSSDKKLAVIKQEFLGDKEGKSLSLKKFIEDAESHKTVFEIVNRLYNTELINWNVEPSAKKKKNKLTYYDLLKDWLSKGVANKSLNELLSDIGDIELEKLLVRTYGLNYQSIQTLLDEIQKDTVEVVIGPVHGDLHAENILINNKINLIDFGWTDYRWKAVDFIWLECSLKYVVCTPSVGINSYLKAEDLIDTFWGREESLDYSELEVMVQGHAISKIIAGINAIRTNIKALGILSDINEYRKGLILMTYSLLSLPKINKIYLIHSMCNNLLKINNRVRKNVAQYDFLYATKRILWPEQPGRMVDKATQILDNSGRCLDIGCGDGKNIAFLKKKAWNVDAFDKSFLAVSGARQRLNELGITMNGNLSVDDSITYPYIANNYELIVNYGLYHCLDDDKVSITQKKMTQALKKGGLVAFAMLNDSMPMPINHGTTGEIYLRSEQFLRNLMLPDYEILELFSGEIEEDHLPIIGKHKHGVTWGLFRKK